MIEKVLIGYFDYCKECTDPIAVYCPADCVDCSYRGKKEPLYDFVEYDDLEDDDLPF